MADICFRHLEGAHENYQKIAPHLWIQKVNDDDPEFGRFDYLSSLSKLGIHESEEYTHSLAAVVFCHVWVLSTANYYRLALKQGTLTKEKTGGQAGIKTVHTLEEIARQLNLSPNIIATAKELKQARNTILHLVTSKNDSFPINEIGFQKAYQFAQCAWEIYIALLEYYGHTVGEGSWIIQTGRFNLPSEFA